MRRAWMVVMTLVVGCLVTSQAAALDVQDIRIFQGTDRINGVIDDYFFELEIEGTGISDGVFFCIDTATWYPLTVDGSGTYAEYENYFVSIPTLLTEHPNPGSYQFYFNKTVPIPTPADFEDTVVLGFAATPPTGFANITNPLHGATGVPLDPTYAWDSVVGYGDSLAMWVVHVATYNEVYEDYGTDMTKVSWQPGALNPGDDYEIEVSVGNFVGGGPLNLRTLNADPFVYTGLFEEININEFTTIPEPVSATLVAAGVLGLVGWRRRRQMRGTI